ncbi:baseplate J/gp47 family protein [Nocardioides sp. WV_118_6]
MPFDPPELETDEDIVADRIVAGLVDRLDGWEAYEGAPEVALAEEIGREAAVLNQAMIDILDVAVAGMGETAFAFPAFQGAAATIAVTIDLNAAGTIVPAGFYVTALNGNGEEVAFELVEDLAAPAATVSASLRATEVGDFANGIPAGPLTIITATSNVNAVTATGPSINGADAELIEDYLDRLVDYLSTLRPGGVTATDLAALARSVPGVHRAIAVDLYDPAAPLVESERTATVFPVDETGHEVPAPVASQLHAVLEAAREVNFVIHVEPPTYTTVAIVYSAVADADENPADVKTEIDAALAGMLTSWGSATDDDQAWVEKTTMRIFDVVRVIGQAPGVAYVDTLTLNGSAADLALAGPAALPKPLDAATTPSSITGTVS